MNFEEAYEYALEYGPSDETRKIICENSEYAYFYAKYIDKCFREDTWMAVKNTEYEEKYNQFLNQIEKEKII
jgi:hypothetical protein